MCVCVHQQNGILLPLPWTSLRMHRHRSQRRASGGVATFGRRLAFFANSNRGKAAVSTISVLGLGPDLHKACQLWDSMKCCKHVPIRVQTAGRVLPVWAACESLDDERSWQWGRLRVRSSKFSKHWSLMLVALSCWRWHLTLTYETHHPRQD